MTDRNYTQEEVQEMLILSNQVSYEQGKKDGIKRALEILNYSKSEFKLLEKELMKN